MINILNIFEPYLFFIIMFTTLLVNAFLILKGIGWIQLIVANIIIIIIFEFAGIGEYNFINIVVGYVVDVIVDVFNGLVEVLGDFFSGIFSSIGKFFTDLFDSLKFWN